MGEKEALVVIVDVGESMREGGFVGDALRAASLLVQQKILFSSTKGELLSLVLLGTRETKNELAESGRDFFRHVYVAQDLETPSAELLRLVTTGSARVEEQGGDRGDALDALVVALDMLQKRVGKKKMRKRVFLITDGGSPSNDSNLAVIVERFASFQCALNIIAVDPQPLDTPPAGAGASAADVDSHAPVGSLGAEEEKKMKEKKAEVIAVPERTVVKSTNQAMLRRVAEEAGGTFVSSVEAMEWMTHFRKKEVLQRTTFRGQLEISPDFSIGVYSFIKCKEQSLPSLKKVFTGAGRPGDAGAAPPDKVQQARAFQHATDPDVEVPREEVQKGFRYGKSIVPFSKADEAALKYRADKCLMLIGFTDSKLVPRCDFMSSTEVLVPDPTDANAGKAFSAVVAAMAETDSVMIARYVKNTVSTPKLVAMFPRVKNPVDCMYMQIMPFMEDLRSFPFRPLSATDPRAKRATRPSAEQLRATAELIDSMDLMQAAEDADGNKVEALKPKRTYNPALQRYYGVLKARLVEPNCPLTEPDPAIQRSVEPDPEVVARTDAALREYLKSFSFEKAEATEKKFWKDLMEDKNLDVKLKTYLEPDAKRTKRDGDAAQTVWDGRSADGRARGLTVDSLMSRGVDSVGFVTPVKDFEGILARRDVDLVLKAMEELKKRTLQLVEDSLGAQYYPKALECLAVLRRGCVQEDEPELFNAFLLDCRRSFEGKARDGFWKLVSNSSLTLIHNGESLYSSVTPSESERFLEQPMIAPPAAPPKPEPPKPDKAMEDLFAMAD